MTDDQAALDPELEARVQTQVEEIFHGCAYGDENLERSMREEFTARLRKSLQEDRPLKVYVGYDPSRPDLHLGHTITLRKLALFGRFGHDVTFLVGTFTAQLGDASDKAAGRPRKSPEEVLAASESYADQCFKILDREQTTVRYNADWLGELPLAEFVNTASNFTVQQFLTRDNFAKRIESGDPIGLHELFYALLQGYDAMHLDADVQMGATEQLFNIMAGRKLQQAYGKQPSICITFPVLVGLDGTERMSKSTGNIVGIAEPAVEQFAKVMSISDETMDQWLDLVTRWSTAEIAERRAELASGALHPMELKKRIAWDVVAMCHDDAAADEGRARFEEVHQKHKLPDDMPEVEPDGPTNIIELLVANGMAESKSAARRLIQGKGVKVDGEAVFGIDFVVSEPCVVQVGRRKFLRVK